jgi:hypothetical protein
MTYTLQVSNHPRAGGRIPTQEAADSWKTVYDGPIASSREAMEAIEGLARFYRHARGFRGQGAGKLWYAVLRMEGGT